MTTPAGTKSGLFAASDVNKSVSGGPFPASAKITVFTNPNQVTVAPAPTTACTAPDTITIGAATYVSGAPAWNTDPMGVEMRNSTANGQAFSQSEQWIAAPQSQRVTAAFQGKLQPVRSPPAAPTTTTTTLPPKHGSSCWAVPWILLGGAVVVAVGGLAAWRIRAPGDGRRSRPSRPDRPTPCAMEMRLRDLSW